MKLHIPVLLLRSVIAAMSVLPAVTCADIKALGSTIPEGYELVLVDEASDITQYSLEESNLAFSVSRNITITDKYLTIPDTYGWYIFDATRANRYSLTFNRAASLYGGETNSFSVSDFNGVYFRDNQSWSLSGGAIYLGGRETNALFLCNNDVVSVESNTCDNSYYTRSFGAAFYIGFHSDVKINSNKSVTFSKNGNERYLSDLAWGGALCVRSGLLEMNDNESILFSQNTVRAAEACGGAILLGNNGYATLNIRNNDSVLFEKNAEISENSYRLRGVHLKWCCTGDITVNFSAPVGKSIEFRDSLMVEPAWSETHLNQDYTNADGALVKQRGDIIFTGKYTEEHLNELLVKDNTGRRATAAEITDSRTSIINGYLTLYAGALRVEDGAILQGGRLTVQSGNAARVLVKNAQMTFTNRMYFQQGTTLTIQDSGMVNSNLTFESGSHLNVQGTGTITGALTFKTGSNLNFSLSAANKNKAVLTLKDGSIKLNGTTSFFLNNSERLTDNTTYILLEGVSMPTNWASYILTGLPKSASTQSRVYWSGTSLYFYYDQRRAEWTNRSGNRKWDTSSTNWTDEGLHISYADQSVITFGNTGAGDVFLTGTLSPESVTVNNGSSYNYTWQGSGKLAGSMKLYKKGAGTLTIKNTNDFTGGTYISGGKVVLEANNALGSGPIQISGGASLSSSGSVYAQSLTLSGNAQFYAKGSVAKAVTLTGNLESTGSKVTMFGTLKLDNLTLKNSTMSNNGSSAVNIAMKNRAYLSASSLTLGGTLSGTNLIMSGSQLTQSGSAAGLSMSGKIAVGSNSTLTTAGSITGTNLAVTGNSTLNAKNATARSITLTGNLEGTKATMNMYGNVKANNLALKLATLTNSGTNDSTFTIGNRAYLTDTTMTQKGDMTAKNMTLSNSKLTHTGSKLALGEKLALGSKSTLNSNAALSAINVILTGGSTLNVQNAAAKDVSVSSNLQVTDSTLKMHGNLNAGNLVVQNGSFLGNGKTAKSYVVRNKATLSNAKLDINGYLNAKAATLSGSHLKQYGHANGVKITGQLTMFNNSTITTSGTLSAGAMTLTGGTINLTSDTLKAINVTNAFTLNKAIDLNLGCTNLVKGKDYKLITFKTSNLTKKSNLASLLGMSGSGATLTLNSSNIAIRVTNTTAWNKYLTASKNAFSSTTMAMLPETEAEAAAEGEMAEEIVTTSLSETTEAVASFDRSGADALVQSNWGMLNATRAFTDTIGNRAANRRALGEEQKSAVWMSAMGASTRLSSDGEAAGSDYNLYGAAFGMEQQLTGKSSLGLAIGESRGKVSSFTATRTKQDTLHTALYGQHLLQQSTSDALTLDWSAAYGRTESKWQGMEWEQKSVQLDARATWAHQLNAGTTVSGFAGMQYYASETGDVAPGIESGSIRNLRGEIGAGIGHRATSKTSIYGELSFVGDMVRHNPTASIGEQREGGVNPGRVGLNLSAGVNHALNEKWSVNASYNLELQERANSHSANIGADYKF